MTGTLALLHLAGAVALLLWGTHMVTTGVARGFGIELRALIGRGLGNRLSACLAGLATTAVLQSSTATALIATSFAASGALDLPSGIALMLGANVGTALIVEVLSFDVTAVAPVLILLGFLLFRLRSGRSRPRNGGRMLIGLGLMLTALSLLGQTLAGFEAVPVLREALGALGSDPVLSVLVAAALAWAAHSSVAVVLFVTSLAASGALTTEGALALVIGANLGAALVPCLEVRGTPAARRLPLVNLLVRATGCAAALCLLQPLVLALGGAGAARAAVLLHLGFNVSLAVLALPWTSPLAALAARLLPDPPAPTSADRAGPPEERASYLDAAALSTPRLALANATLEALHMADLAGAILRDALRALRTGDRALAAAIGRRDAVLDAVGLAIRRYLAELGGEEVGSVTEGERERGQEVLGFVLNVEHIGDITANNLVEFASQHLRRTGAPFSQEEVVAIERLHGETVASLQLALAAFLRDDDGAAREVVRRKALLLRLERGAVEEHTRRLRRADRDRDAGAAEASALFLRTLRDLRRVHSHAAALCGPLLERRDMQASGAPGAAEPDEGGLSAPSPGLGDAGRLLPTG